MSIDIQSSLVNQLHYGTWCVDQFVITSFTLDMAEVCAGPGSCAAPVNGTGDTTCSAAKSRVSSQYDPIIIIIMTH